ncbi:hypothetical protein GGI14_001292 [Coemansia sp. S680]|nr:hypothetical protein GGI14_001292 [Coemansia sp. S680]
MVVQSAFQLLPPHDVKLIVDHVADSSRLRFNRGTLDYDKHRELQMPLLWVCHNFRALVHQRFCREYELTLKNNWDRAEAYLCSWPRRDRKLGYPTHKLAKELIFRLYFEAAYSGNATQLLSDEPYNDWSFPLVRELTFCLVSDDDDCDSDYNSTSDDYDSWESESDNTDGDSLESDRDSDDSRETDSDDDRETDGDNDYTPDTTANIATFVQRVKQMAPTVRKIEEIPYARANNLLKRRDVHIIDLVQQLFGIVEKHTVVAYGRDFTVGCLDLESTRDLVRIQYFMDQSADAAMQLIHSNVRTLQHLDLDVGEADVTGLVRDPNGGGYLEYPCLHTLKIYSVYDRVLSEEAIFKDIVPFPRLSRLSVWPYLFGDNVLFRGNSATFEYLEVELSQETVSMLRKCRIFTPTSHPNLKCVKIRLPLFDIPRAFVTAAEYTQFVLSIAPGASVRKISGLTKYPEDRTPALSMLKDHGCIQILSLPDTSLSLWDVISLVKSLPFLSDLHTQPMSGSELPQDISMDTLPGYIRATYGSIGRRFRCWHIETEWRTELNYVEAATFILLLALVFPNFDYAAIDKTHCIPFMSAMKKKIADPEFSQDAPRLSRLLFNGWNDC